MKYCETLSDDEVVRHFSYHYPVDIGTPWGSPIRDTSH